MQNAFVNSVHAQAAQYGVDGGQQKSKTWLYLEKEGVFALIAIALHRFKSNKKCIDGCKKVRNEFPLLHLVQTYITFHRLLRTFLFFAIYFICKINNNFFFLSFFLSSARLVL